MLLRLETALSSVIKVEPYSAEKLSLHFVAIAKYCDTHLFQGDALPATVSYEDFRQLSSVF